MKLPLHPAIRQNKPFQPSAIRLDTMSDHLTIEATP